jgi:Ribonuclease G/E
MTVALEALRALAREADTTPARVLVLHVHPEVAAVLTGEAEPARRELESRLGRPIEIVATPGQARDEFDIGAR